MTIGVEHEVPWPGARLDGNRRRRVRGERACDRIESVDHHAIEAKVGRDQETVGGVEDDRVSVRPLLSFRRAAALSGNDGDGRCQTSVGRDRQECVVTAGVICDREEPAGLVELEVTRMGAARGLGADGGQFGRGGVDGKRRDTAARCALVVVELVDREDDLAVRARGQKTRARRRRGEAARSERACGVIELKRVDAVAAGCTAGVRAHENQSSRRRLWRRGRWSVWSLSTRARTWQKRRERVGSRQEYTKPGFDHRTFRCWLRRRDKSSGSIRSSRAIRPISSPSSERIRASAAASAKRHSTR